MFKTAKEIYFAESIVIMALVTQIPVCFSNLGSGSTIATVSAGSDVFDKVQVIISVVFGLTEIAFVVLKRAFFFAVIALILPS